MEKPLVLAVCSCTLAGYVGRDIGVHAKTALQNTSIDFSGVLWFVGTAVDAKLTYPSRAGGFTM